MKFLVKMKEVHTQVVEIEADTEKQALDRVEEGEGEYGELEYDHTLDTSEWTAEATE